MIRRQNARRGQSGTEYMLVVSVAVLAIVLAGYGFVPKFRQGVDRVGSDVERMLSTGQQGRRRGVSPSSVDGLPGGGGYYLPQGPRDRGCASGTACNPLPAANPLGLPVTVCRSGEHC